MVVMQLANAAIPEADEAIPLECGKVFVLSMSMRIIESETKRPAIFFKNASIFGSKLGLGSPLNLNLNSNSFIPGWVLKSTVVSV